MVEPNVKIVCEDGILTEEHLFALKEGEVLELTDVKEMHFKNVVIGGCNQEETNE